MLPTRRQLEDDLVEYSRRLHGSGWVANHDGNVSVRLAEDRFLITPTAVSKGDVSRDMLLVVDGAGNRISGVRKAFSELDLHLYIYRQRPDVRAVVHAHPPTATGLSVAGVPVRSTMLAEAVVSLGAQIPLVPYARPKTPEFTLNLAAHIHACDAVVLEQHGVLSFGPTLETAFLRMELVEHLAKVQLVAMQAGRVRELLPADVAALVASRAQAGVGAPPAADVNVSAIRSVVLQEMGRAV